MIAILDYGSGNLRSAERAFAAAGVDVRVTSDSSVAIAADGLVVPGVGAYAACMSQLSSIDGTRIIQERLQAGKKILGICVGMQILFDEGTEKKSTPGLALLPGRVSPIENRILPHIGWNTVSAGAGSQLFRGLDGESFYFVHSFAAHTPVPNAINSITEYEDRFLSAVESELISATQFHPEKSGDAGARLIRNWVESL